MLKSAALRFAPLLLLALGGCATSSHWAATGSNKDLGVVRVSYEYAGNAPAMSAAQADVMAENRCDTWGFERAELIPGTVRDCASNDGGACAVWKVTREYQCEKGSALAESPPVPRYRSVDRKIDEAARAPLDAQRVSGVLH